MSSPDPDGSTSPSEGSLARTANHVRTVFVCGFMPKRWHNNSLESVMHDLSSNYFVCCNGPRWQPEGNTRALLLNTEAFIFFVNEYTLGDRNCLLTLQHAYHMMIPIIMLRPPRTKLVICARQNNTEHLMCPPNGSICKSPVHKDYDNHNLEDVDYPLLQDILYEGYRISIVYDRLDHKKSMIKIHTRVEKIIPHLHPRNFPPQSPSSTLPTTDRSRVKLCSPNNNRSLTRNSANPPPNAGLGSKLNEDKIRHSKSTGNLSSTTDDATHRRGRAPTLRQQSLRHKTQARPLKVSAIEDEENTVKGKAPNMGVAVSAGKPSFSSSFSSSFDRRCSVSSLDDFSNYQSTQYLVFPIQDKTKKPILVKFPDDLIEETFKNGDVWGSDTSLEEEVEIASQVGGQIAFDLAEDDSPIQSPAPYIDSLA